ncbi:MAG: nucleoside triphosphate pyrophosphohydrolase [Candidatus Marinimicrobia bacterium]|nr:nucleoside triphosphate pyrophosphohydrolase [Candidatus Neomarinimicrobiota bacterium]
MSAKTSFYLFQERRFSIEESGQKSYSIEFNRLIEIMQSLRSENGCEWDKKQTHESLRQYLIEEAYEAVEAIDNMDMNLLKEELGDLLLHVVFHARLGEEKGNFDIDAVLAGINEKLIRRHPHVFGENREKDVEKIKMDWEESKQKEGRESRIDGIPKNMSGLQRAFRLQEKAASTGFDWDNVEDVWAKLDEEIQEVRKAADDGNKNELEEEIGDLIFSAVNLSRFMGVNPEDALRRTIKKFETRFKSIEKAAEENGRNITELSLEEMDKIWESNKIKGQV